MDVFVRRDAVRMAGMDPLEIWRHWLLVQASDRRSRLLLEEHARMRDRPENVLSSSVMDHEEEAVTMLVHVARTAPSDDGLAWLGAGYIEDWLMDASSGDVERLRLAFAEEPNLRTAAEHAVMTEEQRRQLGLDRR